MVLENRALSEVSGGGVAKWYFLGGLLSLVAGIINGLVNPLKCNNK